MSHFSQTMSRIVALSGLTALLACTQPPAKAQADKETTAMRQAPTQEDERAATAAADAAAAAADAAAGPGVDQPAPQEDPESMRLPPGPALTPQELMERVMRLAASLRTPADTEPASVAKTLDLPLTSDEVGYRIGTTGALTGSGSYSVAVWKLYREEAPGQHIDVMLFPASWKGDPREPKHELSECTTRLGPFHDRLLALGFKGTRGPLYRPEQWSYFKEVDEIAFYVQLDVYRVADGSDEGLGCVMQASVDAAHTEDIHGKA